jgi:EpsI family protein
MSVTDLPPLTQAQDLAPPARRAGRASAWVRLAVACAILVGSGLARAWQQQRITRALEAGRRDPLDLRTVPTALGEWRGEPYEIDPQIARGTGANQVVTRRYVHQVTGATIDLILLFGPGVEMFIHAPENCYPTAGFTQVAGGETRAIATGRGGETAPFRVLVYSKGEGPRTDLQEVYYTWRYNGRWTLEVGKAKHFERIPGAYKVHVARRVSDHERRDVDNPSEAFLKALMPELEKRLPATPAT